MEKLKFEFKMRGTADGKSNILCITSIETPDGRMFTIPEELQPVTLHDRLNNHPAFTKIKKTLTKRNQFRKIWITVDDTIKEKYLDEEENLQFNDYFLEETTNKPEETAVVHSSSIQKLLETLVENNKRAEDKSLDKIAKEITIQKFNNKTQNASQWLSGFEEECERYNISEDKRKIKLLKFFLDKSCFDWYECVLIKLTINSEWEEWKKRFCDTFANKGWSPIRYAIMFKYQTGSLLEYALRKEKLLLETRRSIDTGTLIDLIAVGLPNFVSDKINRETLLETEDLYNELGKLEHLVYRNFSETKKINGQKSNTKVPCIFCKEKIKKIRFHPEENCWFKNKEQTEKKVNNSLFDIEAEGQDPKNLQPHH